MANINEVPSVA